jgi:hypothetical protein
MSKSGLLSPSEDRRARQNEHIPRFSISRRASQFPIASIVPATRTSTCCGEKSRFIDVNSRNSSENHASLASIVPATWTSTCGVENTRFIDETAETPVKITTLELLHIPNMRDGEEEM